MHFKISVFCGNYGFVFGIHAHKWHCSESIKPIEFICNHNVSLFGGITETEDCYLDVPCVSVDRQVEMSD